MWSGRSSRRTSEMPKTNLILIRVPAHFDPERFMAGVELETFLNPPEDGSRAQLCGVWREPSSFCTCTTVGRGSGFTLGQKVGWWVHSACRKPKSWWSSKLGQALFTALGKNQLENAPEEFRYEPRNWRRMLDEVG